MKTLFKLTFLHQYYRGGDLQESQLMPHDATADILKRVDILVRNEGNQFYFLLPFDADAIALLDYLVVLLDGKPLTFSLTHNPAQFTYITELPLNWCGQFLFSSSETTKPTSGEFVMQAESLEQIDFREDTIAVINIYPQDVLLAGAVDVRYLVDFSARQTYWRYYIFNRSKVKVNNPVVSDGDGIIFGGPQKVTMENGEEALSFTSEQRRFPIQQMPLHVFNLVDRLSPNVSASAQVNEIDIISGLPTPAVNHLISQKIDGEELIVSEMYVYL